MEITLTQLLKNAFRSQAMEMHTCIPAKVLKYNAKTCTVDVKIGVKRKFVGEDYKEYPIIPDVPVRFMRSAGSTAILRLPIKKGDTGLLLFTQRSIEKWLVSKDVVEPDDPRIFDISDATFAPDLVQDHKAKVSENDSVELSYGKMSIELWPDGKIEIKGATDDFVTIVHDLIDGLISAKTLTAIGPQPFTVDTIAKFTQLKTKIATLKK